MVVFAPPSSLLVVLVVGTGMMVEWMWSCWDGNMLNRVLQWRCCSFYARVLGCGYFRGRT